MKCPICNLRPPSDRGGDWCWACHQSAQFLDRSEVNPLTLDRVAEWAAKRARASARAAARKGKR